MASPRSGGTGPGLSTFQALTVASQFGVTLAVAVGLGLFVGQWLDGIFHTAIVFTLIGVFLGLITAVMSTVTIYRVYLRRSEQEWRERKSASANAQSAEDQTETGPGPA